jgi:pimeloyl-ACP methyl ester carboxylesterase
MRSQLIENKRRRPSLTANWIVFFRFSALLVSLAGFWALGCPSSYATSPESQFFTAKGVKIHYLLQGTGEPVVLIHGWYSSAVINWQWPGTIAALAKEHQVIALDLPGYGQSDKPHRDQAYGLQWVEDVILLLDHLNIQKAHIVGYSMGGMVALKLISEHPDRALSGTLGGMGWMPEGSGLQKIWAGMKEVSARNVSKLALTEDDLKAIRTPVRILIGNLDPVKKLYVDPLEAVRKDWQVVEIQGAGHITCIFKKQFINGIVEWVDTNRQK